MNDRAASPAWRDLQKHAAEIGSLHLRQLFSDDPERFGQFSLEALELLLDYSRQRITRRTRDLLIELARRCELERCIGELFAGNPVNLTEDRPALHMALRNRSEQPMLASGKDVMPLVRAELAKMRKFVESVHEGRHLGARNQRFTDIVNIGIGGSDLGIVMATEALGRYRNRGLKLHCVSNVDGVELADTLESVDPATTLFVVCSKTFTTLETLSNATAARDWLVAELGEQAVAKHFVAVSTNHQAMDRFGIDRELRFTIWDWVGGRYSLWSAVGLSIALALGMDQFEEMLLGGFEMDQHFRQAPLESNLPVMMGLIGVWNINFLGYESLAVLPYDRRLHRFPAYLQQLEMESNGKHVTREGRPVRWSTGAVVWGEPGSNAQHSFFQLLHQGTARVALDFIVPANASSRFQGRHDLAIANCFAQAEAFAFGQTEAQVRKDLEEKGTAPDAIEHLLPHKVHAGNVPSSLLMFPRMEPRTLGKLIALYEHKVFVQSVLWNINPFDQWGVELGKKLANSMVPAVQAGVWQDGPAHVQALLDRLRDWRAG